MKRKAVLALFFMAALVAFPAWGGAVIGGGFIGNEGGNGLQGVLTGDGMSEGAVGNGMTEGGSGVGNGMADGAGAHG